MNQCWPNSAIHILYINEYIPLHIIIWTDIWIYAMAQVVAWRLTGDNPLPEPMLTKFYNTYYILMIISHYKYIPCTYIVLILYLSVLCCPIYISIYYWIQVHQINFNDSIDKRFAVRKSRVSTKYYHIILIPVQRVLDLSRIQHEWGYSVSLSKM